MSPIGKRLEACQPLSLTGDTRLLLLCAYYLSDVLRQLADARQNCPSDLELNSERLRNLLPDRWAEQHPQSIRQARVEEKIDRAEAKRVRRALRRQEQRAAKQPNA